MAGPPPASVETTLTRGMFPGHGVGITDDDTDGLAEFDGEALLLRENEPLAEDDRDTERPEVGDSDGLTTREDDAELDDDATGLEDRDGETDNDATRLADRDGDTDVDARDLDRVGDTDLESDPKASAEATKSSNAKTNKSAVVRELTVKDDLTRDGIRAMKL